MYVGTRIFSANLFLIHELECGFSFSLKKEEVI